MARKPKAQLSTEPATALPLVELAARDEAPTAARRGGKQKAAAPSPELPLAAGRGSAATAGAKSETHMAEPIDAPRRKGLGRKQMPSAAAEVAPLLQNKAGAQRGPKPRKPGTEPPSDPVADEAPTAEMASPVEAAASDDPVQPDADSGSPSEDAQQPLPGVLDTPAMVRPAAH